MHRDRVQASLPCYNAVLGSYNYCALPRRALRLLKTMRDEGLDPDRFSYQMAIGAAARAGEIAVAKQLMQELRENDLKPDVGTFSTVISACTRGGRGDVALEFFDEMPQQRVEPNLWNYTAAISACKVTRKWERAAELLREMQAKGLRPPVTAYNTVLLINRRRWTAENAMEMIRQMREQNEDPNLMTYGMAMNVCCNRNRWQQAITILQMMHQDYVYPDSACYKQCLNVCSENNKWEQMVRLIEDMREQHVEPGADHLQTVMEQCTLGGKYELALKIAQSVSPGQYQNYGHSHVPQGRWGEPMPHRQSAQQAFNPLDGLEHAHFGDVLGYLPSDLLSDVASERQAERADGMGLPGRPAADPTVPPELHSVRSYNAAISACEPAGQAERALRLLEDMRGKELEPDFKCYGAAISACGMGEQWQSALSLLSTMRKQGLHVPRMPEGSPGCTTGTELQANGSWQLALECLQVVMRKSYPHAMYKDRYVPQRALSVPRASYGSASDTSAGVFQ
mmetsp:Transcript_42720/g.79476  ORF Transcript_42720/g.79476 Transcript_42720/m.79476 type:complete len:510 (+) Transcript_42720:108-1637(+)